MFERPRIMLGALTREQFLGLAAGQLEIPLFDQEAEANRTVNGGAPISPSAYLVLSADPAVQAAINLLLTTPAIQLRQAI